MKDFIPAICQDYLKDPANAKVKYSFPGIITKNQAQAPHFLEAYKHRKRTVLNLKVLAQDKQQYTENLLDLGNLYFMVAAFLSLSCDCCIGEASDMLQLKQIGKQLKQEETIKQHTDTQKIYFLTLLKLVNPHHSLHHSFTMYVNKMSDNLVDEYKRKYNN